MASRITNLGNRLMSKENETVNESAATTAVGRSPTTKRRLLAAVLATSLAAVSVIAYAAGATGASPHHGAGMHGDTYAQINVTHLHLIVDHVMGRASPEQKAKIDVLVAAAKPELQSLDAQATAAHRETVGLLLQDNVDRAAVEHAQAREIQAADQLAKRIDQALADLAELMTPEQKAQLREHVKAHAG
jgi:Spy/CpxP family protein refolding chaperone